MSTSAQIDANRANSRKSTGPRTGAGKSRSAQNARQHGLCSRDLVLLPGEEDEFDEMRVGLYEEILPEGALEDELFKALIHAAWNQRRCRRAEADLQKKAAEKGLDPLLDPALDSDLRRLDLYARRAANAFHKNMKALRDLQTERDTRRTISSIYPEASFDEIGLTRLAEVRKTLQNERSQAARIARTEILAGIQAIELERRRLEAGLIAVEAAERTQSAPPADL